MNPSPIALAAAASDAYIERDEIETPQKKIPIYFDHQQYRRFGYKADPVTGFHATAYQNVVTGDIIIAYRGTDPDYKNHFNTTVQDSAVDAAMVRDKINPQKPQADAFTQAMLDQAQKLGIPKDHVYIAGHSLGGTLGEIEAAEFGLQGITFNAYGAAGLADGPPKEGFKLTNYVMAGDVVSAANNHIGEVVTLASPDDVKRLRTGRYLDAPAGSPPPNPLLAMSLSDHSNKHFVPLPGSGEISVLDPQVMAQYQKNFADNKAAFSAARSDMQHDAGELAEAARQANARGDNNGSLPPDLQQQLNEYFTANNQSPEFQKLIDQNVVGVVNQVVNGYETFVGEHLSDMPRDPVTAYRSISAAVEQVLSQPPATPQNPNVQPLGPNDAAHDKSSPWMRDPQDGTWFRTFPDRDSATTEKANPAQSLQLEKMAQATLQNNLDNSPYGVALRYKIAYDRNGWSQYGPLPLKVTDALKTPDNVQLASDGHTYTRGEDGQWTTKSGLFHRASTAEGNIFIELNAAQALRQQVDNSIQQNQAQATNVKAAEQSAVPIPAYPPQTPAPPAMNASAAQPAAPAQTAAFTLDLDTIRAAQHNLVILGFTNSHGQPLPATGVYDRPTESAVMDFQQEQHLPATGTLDRATYDRIAAQSQELQQTIKQPSTSGQSQSKATSSTLETPAQGDINTRASNQQKPPAQTVDPGQNLPTPTDPQTDHWSVPTPTQSLYSTNDPRNPQNRDHAMYQSVRGQLVALNDTQGIKLSPEKLDNCTAAVMTDARAVRMHSVTHIEFARCGNGQPDPSHVITYQGDPKHPATQFSATDMTQAANTPAEQSFKRFAQNTQALDQSQQRMHEQMLAERQSQDMPMQVA